MSSSVLNDAIDLTDVPRDQWRKHYMSDGYRSCYYTVDQSDGKGKVILFGFDKKECRKTFICPHKCHIKYAVKYKTDEQDARGRYVATKWFDTKRQRDKYIEQATGLTIVEAMRPEDEFLHEMFDDVALDPEFNKQRLRVHYFDIETEISDRFMPPAKAENRINMMTVYDNFTETFYTWSLQHAEAKFHDFEEKVEWFDIKKAAARSKDEDDVHFETCDHQKVDTEDEAVLQKLVDEKQNVIKVTKNDLKSKDMSKFKIFEFNDDEIALLMHFIDWMQDNYADVSYGWNSKGYDWPYVVRRIENVLGKNAAAKLSPVGRYFIKEVKKENSHDISAENDIEVKIPGLFIADGLVLYRDKFHVKQALDGGYGLSNVGEAESLGKKIVYDGSLKDLYEKDFQKFYEYNVRDVDLVVRIDAKRKTLQQARQITSFGLADYNQIYGSIAYLIGSIVGFSKTSMGGKVFPSYMREKKQFDSFDGAFVFPTISGLWKGGTGTLDFASLYPSCIRALNVSPETYVGKVLVYFKDPFGNVRPYTWSEQSKQLDKETGKMKMMTVTHSAACNEKNEVPFDIHDDSDTLVERSDATMGKISAGCKQIHHLELLCPDGKTHKPITLQQLRDLVKTKCIWTPNNTLFLKHEVKWGVVAKWSEHFYSLRKMTKKKMLALEHKLHDEDALKGMTKEQVAKMKLDMENFDMMQLSLKTMINSVYGMLGTAFSCIADPHIAQSVTRMGQFCNRNANNFVFRQFREMYNCDENYRVALGGDTDSFIKTTQLYIKKK